jgi:predicted enzyme related to lactoylglutathione lyase
MPVQSLELAWVVVSDFKAALKFYTETLGLKVMELSEEYGWAELQGPDGGMRLGLAKQSDNSNVIAGQNAVVALTVKNIEKTKEELIKKGAKCVGELQVIPGHVKLQMIADADGNLMQLAETTL